MTDEVKTGLPPIARADARLFILGSLPGDASLAAQQYYAHPQNQFWRLVGSVVGEDLQRMPYAVRLERLAEHRIGVWDVIGSAVRRGSLDQAIRDANHNRIEHLVHDFPDLQAIAFNGGTSAAIGRRLIGGRARAAAHRSPVLQPREHAAVRREGCRMGAFAAVLHPRLLCRGPIRPRWNR